MALEASARLIIRSGSEDLPGAFGAGCAELLRGVEREHSLNRAAKDMGMAYSKAWRLMKEAEAHLGTRLLDRDGARGSQLTAAGKLALQSYDQIQGEISDLAQTRVEELLGGISEAL